MIRKISGKGGGLNIRHLNQSGYSISEPKQIVNTIGQTISNNSSSKYTRKFQRFKQRQEKQRLNFTSNNTEPYNQFFTIQNLKDALHDSHDSVLGPDDIHYHVLKHLPNPSLEVWLHIFNNICDTGTFPDSWKGVTIISVSKPGKY